MRNRRSWQLAAVSWQLLRTAHCKLQTPVIDPRSTIHAVWFLAAAVLGGCGMEAATTAATGAAIKKQEIDAGKKTMSEVQQKVDQATQLMQENAQRTAESADK